MQEMATFIPWRPVYSTRETVALVEDLLFVYKLPVREEAMVAPVALQSDCFSAIVRVIATYALMDTDRIWREAVSAVTSHIRSTIPCTGVFRVINV